MGRGKKSKGKDNGHVNGERKRYKKFEELARDNKNLRKYYQAQKIVSEEEFPEMIEAMRTVLPTNFRISGSRQQATDIRELIMTEFVPHIRDTQIDGVDIEAPHPLPWYPNNFGWQFSIPRMALRKSKELRSFHSFLVTETEIGNISRQEAVSMVPPLFLDVRSDHMVLDMCAAPGSKTAQLIEALHADAAPGTAPTGVVVANDADYKRACMLVHQINRLNSPNIVVTNHSGERFPNILKSNSRDIVQFDRILCDVPCSGDGTTRKNVRVWETWHADDAHSLNPLQIKILQRAAYLLKVGGRLVYSTCSLNPVENEAVVAHVLEHFEGALKLVDVSTQLPELKRRSGLKTWKVMTRDGEMHETSETIGPEVASRSTRKHMEGFFPLPAGRMDELHIEHCMRIYPHLQNTGGFFVAVLEKVAPIGVNERKKAAEALERARQRAAARSSGEETPMQTEDELKRAASEDEGAESKRQKTDEKEDGSAKRAPFLPDSPREDPALRENPFVFLDPNTNKELQAVLDYYGIKDSMSHQGFLSRMENGLFRSVYYVADSVRQLMELAGQRLRVVNTGIKVFGRSTVKEAGCTYRLVCEGVPQLLTHLGDKFVIEMTFSDLRVLIEQVNPLLTQLSDETRRRVEAVDTSCSVIMCYDPAKHVEDNEKPHTRLTALLAIPCWRGAMSVSAHINKNQLRSLNHRVLGRTANTDGVGDLKLENNIHTSASSHADTPAADAQEP
ncbi:tRNA (cytosine-5-)-methyltransferase ncl1 [Coemansia brasiliensis]|uniref:tRNA (Cytosine-5-)-methyltransferase ncl1 n=1 Tax=Coemansia brasiliensis TaxID=2650707 RepID=A0A9W8LYD1_9FUNG|nr:tRNA (cytosine-5-)-methyltransferase ncl1 [Coemansia brasiliensis]